MRTQFQIALIVLPSLLSAQPRPAARPVAQAPAVAESLFANLGYRNIGPANMSGRMADVEGVAGDPAIIYVGSASGGVWKSTNAGTTWTPIFDKQPVQSIGDLALDPTNPEVVYVGTGEANVRNSVSFGNGVYKTTDGGKTWRHLGLADTRHISRIVVNPQNPNKVYVAAVGHAFGPNEERGVFMSEDAGETWKKVLYLDNVHGAADLDIDPLNPNRLYATMWYFDRKQWTHRSGSEASGVFRSTDGGKTWTKATKGLPKLMGRIGIKVAPSSPNVVYIVAETREGYVFKSTDHGETWVKTSDNAHTLGRGFYYADLRVDPQNDNKLFTLGMAFMTSVDGGHTFTPMAGNFHGDHQTMWIDPKNPKRMFMGDDGGMNVSRDAGKQWEWFPNLPVGQFYQLSYDMREPFYHVAGGLQDNGVWTGPSRVRGSQILLDDWRFIQNGDGYYAVSHPDNPDLFLSDYQAGGIQATNLQTYEQREASPQVKRMDGYSADSNKVRFNWNAPIVKSPHDGKVVYFAGNIIFRSTDWGKSWTAISGDLSKNDKSRQGDAGGPVLKENTVAEYYGNVFSFAESPVQRGVLWAGTDDGNLQVSQDDGKSWVNVAPNVNGVGPDAVVAGVEPSRTAAGTAYVAFERRMMDDFRPYVYKTTDFGRTWTNITGNLPANNYVQVIREDPKNPALLYLGAELGLYASWTGGSDWTRLHLGNLPAVAVHEVLVHPRDNDLVLATHGRALWVLDDASPIQQMSPAIATKPAHLFPMRVATRFNQGDQKWNWGNHQYRGTNTPYGALITYWLGNKPAADSLVKVEVLRNGTVIRTLKRPSAQYGFNRLTWDMREDAPKVLSDMQPDSADATDWRSRPMGPQVLPGQYAVRLTVAGQSQEQPLTVRIDPTSPVTIAELRDQYEQATRLNAVIANLIDTERNLVAFKGQIDERRSTGTEMRGVAAAADMSKAAGEEIGKLDSVRLQLTRPKSDAVPFYSEGPRPVERAMGLMGSIDNGIVPAIAAQREYLGDVRRDAQTVIELVERQVERTVQRMNPLLQALGLPSLVPPPKKQAAM